MADKTLPFNTYGDKEVYKDNGDGTFSKQVAIKGMGEAVAAPAANTLLAWLKAIADNTGNIKLEADSVDLNTDGIETLLASILAGVNKISGTADSGGTTYLVDATKDFESNALVGKEIKFAINGVEYIRKISSCVGSQVNFPATIAPTNAVITAGSGEGAEGQISIACQGSLAGAAGAGYELVMVAGAATTGDDVATLDTEAKTLTITCNLTGEGAARALAAGSVVTLINNAVGIADKFSASETFTAGNLPLSAEPLSFTGGDAGEPVPAGTEYIIEPNYSKMGISQETGENAVSIADGDDVSLGAKADAAATAGDATPFSVIALLKGIWNKLAGTLTVTLSGSITPQNTVVSVGVASTAVLSANAARKYARFINDSDTVIYLQTGTAVLNQGVRLNPYGGCFEMSSVGGNLSLGAITAISSVAGKTLLVCEGV